MILKKECKLCGLTFTNNRKTPNLKHSSYYIGPIQFGKIQFCSSKCRSASTIGKPLSPEHRLVLSEARRRGLKEGRIKVWSKGKKFSEEYRRKIGKSRIYPKGEKAANWKGDAVGYDALHQWVRNELGTPSTCTKCGRTGLEHKKIQWANISGKYKREHSDWVRLCTKCHHQMDQIARRGWVTKKSKKVVQSI